VVAESSSFDARADGTNQGQTRHLLCPTQGRSACKRQLLRSSDSKQDRQVFLRKSLGTKSLKAANVAATHVLADFDRTLANAEALLKARPLIPSLIDAQIKRMAEYYYATLLARDDEERREGIGSEPLFQSSRNNPDPRD
jgi:hypothetical protein